MKAIFEQIPKDLLYETMCKKDYSVFCKDECYPFLIIEDGVYCVIYGIENHDNLVFSHKEFIKYFYTAKEIRKLKIKKLNETF